MITKKFNLTAFIFNAAYYAGYSEFGKGIKMAIVCGLCPFLWQIIALYAGFKANSELPVGDIIFSWLDAIVVTLIFLSFVVIFHILIQFIWS